MKMTKGRGLTKHSRMQPVEERDQGGRCQNDQENVTEQEIRGPKRHLHNLHNKLACGLRHRGNAKATTIPFPSPPCPVGLIMLKFTGQEDGYQDLLDSSLNGNYCDDTQDRVGRVPELEEPLKKGESE
jgi:hypothetical protein